MSAVDTGSWTADRSMAAGCGSDGEDIVRLLAGATSAPPEVIERIVAEEVGRFKEARVQSFVAILVERAVRRRLTGS